VLSSLRKPVAACVALIGEGTALHSLAPREVGPARLRHETWPKSDRSDFGWRRWGEGVTMIPYRTAGAPLCLELILENRRTSQLPRKAAAVTAIPIFTRSRPQNACSSGMPELRRFRGRQLPSLMSKPDQRASGSGRIWKCTILGVVPLPPSRWKGVRLPVFDHTPRPFQPALGSSMRPSSAFAQKPIG
jgi:hypothetical protein